MSVHYHVETSVGAVDGTRPAAEPRRRRRRRIAALVVVGLLVVATTATVLFKALPASSYQRLDRTDRTAFDQLADVFSASAALPDRLWTSDYRYDRQPLVLLRTDGAKSPLWRYAYLINMSEVVDTSGMQKVSFPDHAALRDVYVSNTFGLATPGLWMPGDFTWLDVGGIEVLGFKFHDGMLGDDPPAGLPFATFAMHEAFHVGKQAGWRYDVDGDPAVFDFPHTPEHRRLLAAEFAILDRVSTADAAEFPQLAADLAAIRAARYQTWPQVKAQDDVEAIEGTATYFERAYQRIAAPDSAEAGVTFVDWLESAWDEPVDDSGLTRNVYYATGAQLGLLLDRVAPSWKRDIEPSPSGRGWTPAESLRQATGVTTAPGDAAVAEITARYAPTPGGS